MNIVSQIAAWLVGIFFTLLCLAILIPAGMSIYDDNVTEDLTDRLMSQPITVIRDVVPGDLFCVFRPKEPASVIIDGAFGRHHYKTWRDIESPGLWTVVGIDRRSRSVVVSTIEIRRLELSQDYSGIPCAEKLELRVERNGTTQRAFVGGADITNIWKQFGHKGR